MEETPGRKQARSSADWVIVERDYRAGIRPLRDIAADHGITEASIRKRAKRDGWSRDLTGRIQAKAEEKVRKEQVRKVGTQESAISTATEKQIVEANAEIIAQADLLNRRDVASTNSLARSQLDELDAMTDPGFRERLEWLGQINDESFVTETGREVKDKANELYRYIISFHGRVKALKDIAATQGVSIPMQRRILKLDAEADKDQSAVDELLAKINANQD